MRSLVLLAALTAATGLSAVPGPEGRSLAAADLTFRVVDAATSNGVAGVTIRRAAAFEGKCPPVRIVTDENGEAHYRGPLPQNVEFDLVSPSFYGVRQLRVLQAPDAEGAWKAMSVGPVAMRRKNRPHPMTRPLEAMVHGRRGVSLQTLGFRVEKGEFHGVGSDGNRRSLRFDIFEPKGPEDGFVLADAFPDELGTPLEAPAEGYRHAKVYLISEEAGRWTGRGEPVQFFSFDPDSREAGPNGNCVVFRHKTDKGFIYGAVLPSRCGLLDVVVNDEPDERSLEEEVAE